MDKVLTAIFEALDKKGLTAAAASRAAVDNVSLIKNMSNARGKNPRYSYQALEKLAEVLDLELYFGPKRADVSDTVATNFLTALDTTLPHRGMASCSTQGWADDDGQREPIARPAWVTDDTAFWVAAKGPSMIPEGIRAGDFCIISPGRAPRVGDRVWVQEASMDKRVSIKRLTKMTEDRVYLRGWMPPKDGVQNSFDEERPRKTISAMYPVIGVYRGTFGKKGVDVDFIDDPRKGSDARPDGLVSVSLMGGAGGAFPKVLGFPEDWILAQGFRLDQLVLVGLSDGFLAPRFPKGSVGLIDTRVREVRTKDLYAIRKSGQILVRRVERMKDGTLILGGDNADSETTLIPPRQLGEVSIVGRFVWGGFQSDLG